MSARNKPERWINRTYCTKLTNKPRACGNSVRVTLMVLW